MEWNCTFPRNRPREKIRGTVWKLLEDNKEITDSYHVSIKKKSCQSNQTPCGDRGSDLVDREKQPVPRVLRKVFDTILYNIMRSKQRKRLRWWNCLEISVRVGSARSVPGWEGEQRAALVAVRLLLALLFYSWWTENSLLNLHVAQSWGRLQVQKREDLNLTWPWQIGGIV